MIEEPFRFVEAIANRREYIETQIATGSPIVALNYAGGVLLFTLGRSGRRFSRFMTASPWEPSGTRATSNVCG